MLGVELESSHSLDKLCTTELHLQAGDHRFSLGKASLDPGGPVEITKALTSTTEYLWLHFSSTSLTNWATCCWIVVRLPDLEWEIILRSGVPWSRAIQVTVRMYLLITYSAQTAHAMQVSVRAWLGSVMAGSISQGI